MQASLRWVLAEPVTIGGLFIIDEGGGSGNSSWTHRNWWIFVVIGGILAGAGLAFFIAFWLKRYRIKSRLRRPMIQAGLPSWLARPQSPSTKPYGTPPPTQLELQQLPMSVATPGVQAGTQYVVGMPYQPHGTAQNA